MKQRGRRSTNLVAIPVDGSPPRLHPPSGLSKAEQSLFDFIVDASPPHHFTDNDQPLLLRYVETCLMARKAAKTPANVGH
jgi:hypothetical protein